MGWWDVAAGKWVTDRKWARGKREFGRDVMSALHGNVQQNDPPFSVCAGNFRFRESRATGPVFAAFEGLGGLNVVRDLNGRIAASSQTPPTNRAVEGSGAPGANAPRDDGELDVAIAIDDQLHVVEAKAVRESGKIGDHIAKLVKIRQELGSQVMCCFLVEPLLREGEIGSGDFVERARKQGVHLLHGPKALDRLEKEIKKLVSVRLAPKGG